MNELDYKNELNDSLVSISSQDILDQYGIIEYTVGDLIREFENAMAYKTEQARTFKILDAADHSEVWKVFHRKIPTFQQTPTNNPITIIKEATKASIMPTSYAGDFRPMTLEARELANTSNKYFQMKWEAADMDAINSKAADFAYLHGTSGVLFGWNNNIVDAADVTNYFNPAKKVQFQAKAWHPSNIFPDPGANTVDEMQYMFFVERKTKTFLSSIDRFKDALYAINNSNDSMTNSSDDLYMKDGSKRFDNEVVTFITCYKRVLRKSVDMLTGLENISMHTDIIYMAGRNILDISKDIQPNCIPFVPLYDEEVHNNFWGISKCSKVLSMVLTLNQLDSTEATTYFKNQNPSEFINSLAGLNVSEYQRKRDNPDAAFTVNCDPRVVQAFAQRPELPKTIDGFRQYLLQQIQQVSGVDSAYLGRSYGSIQTTGGVNQAIDRATMRDNCRIKAIDKFIKKEIEIMVQFFILYGKKESFYATPNSTAHDEAGQALQFDPIQLVARDDIEIVVSNSAPRSNSGYEDAAMKIMEMQMKYNPAEHGYPDFITPEEFIDWLNIPKSQKNIITERMRNQMENMKIEEYTAVLTAIGTLTQGGMPVENALQEIAAQIEQSKVGQLPAANINPGQATPK